ncbi:Fungalysin metallopeptidase-domain-containing protein [Jimgerdemannia flammicorona]|uniref:Extracellular metalloproteinase n=1 Tax=Jimgerdemannia flammicorona TaxID=994334 RepID=A0A433C053_9FUNG|nr:Fungalysin metallopeptidase-domain-containing protein [Jimgerdemannia flammicorona]
MKLAAIATAVLLLLTSQGADAVRYPFKPQGVSLPHSVFRTRLDRTNPSFASTHEDPLISATGFATRELKADKFVVKNAYTSKHTLVTHVYLRQVIEGLEVVNGDINIDVDAQGNILSFGSSFYRGKEVFLRAKQKDEEEYRAFVEKTEKSGVERLLVSISQPDVTSALVVNYVDQDLRLMSEKFSQIVFGNPARDTVPSPPPTTDPNLTFDVTPFTVADSDLPVLSPLDALQSLTEYLSLTAPLLANPTLLDTVSIASTASFHATEPTFTLHNVPFAISPVPVHQALIQDPDGDLRLVWSLQLRMEENWLHAHVDAHRGGVLAMSDWVSDAQYRVFPLPLVDPTEGPRELVTDPYDAIASPNGWHEQKKGTKFTTTSGNNVYAQENTQNSENWQQNYRPDGGKELVFDFPADLEKMEPPSYINASVTNLFYWNNIMHDLSYRYGFDEVAGNFQEDNAGKGGLGMDAVIANAQDGSGVNNANFASPPDGQRGQMRMFVWDLSEPNRDGDLSSGIIIHEYVHGISTRLTGGPANSDCLMLDEAGGMGEGWGDFFASVIGMRSDDTHDKVVDMGSWAANQPGGIRKFPYSTNMITNPETYGMMNQFLPYLGVHAKGEVWAGMLYEVYWNLVDKHNFTASVFPPAPTGDDPTLPLKHILSYGNTLALQLVVDGMKSQPCRPSFVQARDAIIAADDRLTGGENVCDIWRAFAKRGLGADARRIGGDIGGYRAESFRIPTECS